MRLITGPYLGRIMLEPWQGCKTISALGLDPFGPRWFVKRCFMAKNPKAAPRGAHAKAQIETARLSKNDATAFALGFDAAVLDELTKELGVLALAKLRFDGEIKPHKNGDFTLIGSLGASLTQACSVSLDPVKTRIDAKITRRFCKNPPPQTREKEIEMPEDDTLEALGDTINLLAIVQEEIALNMPAFPRKEGVEFVEISRAPEGASGEAEPTQKPLAELEHYKDKIFGSKS